MNGIDDEFIEEALTYERSKKRKPSRALRIVLVAALISVLLTILYFWFTVVVLGLDFYIMPPV